MTCLVLEITVHALLPGVAVTLQAMLPCAMLQLELQALPPGLLLEPASRPPLPGMLEVLCIQQFAAVLEAAL